MMCVLKFCSTLSFLMLIWYWFVERQTTSLLAMGYRCDDTNGILEKPSTPASPCDNVQAVLCKLDPIS